MAICIVCKQNVTPKTGIQCQGSCSAWVHYGCLDYVTDDGRKMVHEPYSNGQIYSDGCVVAQLNDNNMKMKWNNNFDSLSDQYVNMNEAASQVTQETATKSISQGASIYKCQSLGMCSWSDMAYYGHSSRPLEYISCGNVPHVLLPTPYPIQYLPIANKYGKNTNMVDAVNVLHGYNQMTRHERPQGNGFSQRTVATETDDFNTVHLNSPKRNFPAVSFIENNNNSRSNINEFEYLYKSQHPGNYLSSIPLYHFNSPTLRHASTEASDFENFNPFNYSNFLNFKKLKSHLYDSKSYTTATKRFENLYERNLVSTMNLLSLSDSFDNLHMNRPDLAALNAIKYNVAGMHKWISSFKQNKKKLSDTLFKNKSAVVDSRGPSGPLRGSELPDTMEKLVSVVTPNITVSITQSKSAPLSASLQAKLPGDHLSTNKSVAVVTEKMLQNVKLEVECQTSITQKYSVVKNKAVISTNTSLEKSRAILVSKSVGSSNSKFYPPVHLEISNMDKKEKDIDNSLVEIDAPSCPDAKNEVTKNIKCKNLSAKNSVNNLDASVGPDLKKKKLLFENGENLSAGSWTKLPDTISQEQFNKIFGKLLPGRNLNTEDTDDASSDNVLTSCVKNVLSTFEMWSSQICDIFSSRKNEHVSNHCSTVRSEGVINIIRKDYTTSNVYEKQQECLTVKLLTFKNN